MKKIKLISSLSSLGVLSAVIPLAATSCSQSEDVNQKLQIYLSDTTYITTPILVAGGTEQFTKSNFESIATATSGNLTLNVTAKLDGTSETVNTVTTNGFSGPLITGVTGGAGNNLTLKLTTSTVSTGQTGSASFNVYTSEGHHKTVSFTIVIS